MKLFVQKIILFSLPLVILLIASECLLRRTLNDYSYKNRYLSENARDLEVLVLGSSHSFYGINPSFFSRRSFSAANVGQSLKYDCLIYDKYKEDLPDLKYIILPISYFTFFHDLKSDTDSRLVKNYVLFYDLECEFNIKNHLLISHTSPVGVIKSIRRILRGGNNMTVSELGFGLNYSNVEQSDLRSTGLFAAALHTESSLHLLDSNLKLLHNLIHEANKRGVEVVLFTPPACDSYVENLDMHQLSVMRRAIAEVIPSHSAIEYYDFMNDPRFVNEDFKDADHLNGSGAEKLTRIINKLINDKM